MIPAQGKNKEDIPIFIFISEVVTLSALSFFNHLEIAGRKWEEPV